MAIGARGNAQVAPYPQPYGAPYGQPNQEPYQGQPVFSVQPSSSLAQPLPDYLTYSILTMVWCCLPLGIAALHYSIKVSINDTCYNVKWQ